MVLLRYSDTQCTAVPPPPPPVQTLATKQTCIPMLSHVRFPGDYSVAHLTLGDKETWEPLPSYPTGYIPAAQIYSCVHLLQNGFSSAMSQTSGHPLRTNWKILDSDESRLVSLMMALTKIGDSSKRSISNTTPRRLRYLFRCLWLWQVTRCISIPMGGG